MDSFGLQIEGCGSKDADPSRYFGTTSDPIIPTIIDLSRK